MSCWKVAVGGRRWAGGVFFGLLALSAAVAHAQDGASANGLIVQFKNAPSHERMSALSASVLRESEAARMQRVLRTVRMTEVRSRPVGGSAQLFDFGRVLSAAEANAKAEELRKQPEVDWVEPNVRERLLQLAPVVPDDPLYMPAPPTYGGQWWLQPASDPSIALDGVPNIQKAWAMTTGSNTPVIAVLDTGITPHSDLDANVLPGYDFVSNPVYANDGDGRDANASDPGDGVSQAEKDNDPDFQKSSCEVQGSSWHGTIVSGMVGAVTNNTFGVAGVNWNARVLPVRVAGKCGAEVADIVDAMRWAAGLHVSNRPYNPTPAKIVNISFGANAPCGQAYATAVNDLKQQGVIVVAAAGNDRQGVGRPANCSGVIGVASLARNGLKASYSNFGLQTTISTVGGDPLADDGLLTLSNDGARQPGNEAYMHVAGTSFSAPIVSGVISLMLSVNPALTVDDITAGLRATARPHVQRLNVNTCSSSDNTNCGCTTSTCGAGILDAEQAVLWAQSYQQAAPVVSGGGGGGGALGWAWLLGLGAGVLALLFWGSGARAAQREGLSEQ